MRKQVRHHFCDGWDKAYWQLQTHPQRQLVYRKILSQLRTDRDLAIALQLEAALDGLRYRSGGSFARR